MTPEQRLEAIVRTGPTLMRVLTIARDLDLPDWLIFSGAVYQRVLNQLTGRDLDYGIKDYDLAYYDASDTSYEAEDAVIRKVAAAYPPPLDALVEVRNQARVHLWFEGKFGEPYAPLRNSAEALERFTVVAPFGLDDLFALRLRPNPTRETAGFARTAAAAKARWPELTVID